ncbi:MAG: hypothetical protein D8M58_11200 [Calditrichaeota bacterium]|nr:MAG: hypothetical protein DWQ03_10575 [Calditrichota bacterium]MBL1205959.1 hypothetical protein [Calditrichota bacterium]NOG45787.1 hypothetical protein [Calditrichota bacterium]
MQKFIKTVFIGLVMISISTAQNLVDGIAVVVGKEIVLRSEIENQVRNYLVQNKINAQSQPALVVQVRNKVVETMIEQKLMLAQAEIDTITVDPELVEQRVDQRIRYLIDRVGSEDQLEKTFQASMKKIRKDTRKILGEQLLVEQVRQQRFSTIKISRREVEEFYKQYEDSLPQIKESVTISHILKIVSASGDAKEVAFNKISDIKTQLDNGASFEQLAGLHSQDPASSKRGGDLGHISRGDFVKEYETVAFSLNDGETSDIVETQFGFHIIKMVERLGEKVHTKHILIMVQPNEDDEGRVITELNAIKKQADDGKDFAELAGQYSDDENVVKDGGTLGTFETDQLIVPQFKTIVKQLQVGEVSSPFKTDFGYHIVKLEKRQAARTVSLVDDWQKIEELAQNFKIEREYRKWISELKEQVPIDVKSQS